MTGIFITRFYPFLIILFLSLLLFLTSCDTPQGFTKMGQAGSRGTSALITENGSLTSIRSPLVIEGSINASPLVVNLTFPDSINSEEKIWVKATICDEDGARDDEINVGLTVIKDEKELIFDEEAQSKLLIKNEQSEEFTCGEYQFVVPYNLEKGEYRLTIMVSDKFDGQSSFDEFFSVLE